MNTTQRISKKLKHLSDFLGIEQTTCMLAALDNMHHEIIDRKIFHALLAKRRELEEEAESELTGIEYALFYDIARALGLSQVEAMIISRDFE